MFSASRFGLQGQHSNTKRERGQPVLAAPRAPTEIFTSLSQPLDAHFLRPGCISAPTCSRPQKTHKSCPSSFLLSPPPPLRSATDIPPTPTFPPPEDRSRRQRSELHFLKHRTASAFTADTFLIKKYKKSPGSREASKAVRVCERRRPFVACHSRRRPG